MVDRHIVVCCQKNNVEELEKLLHSGLNANSKDEYGEPLLHIAAMFNSKDCVRLLIDAGADVNTKTKYDGATALHVACVNDSKETLCLLLEAGADINAKNHMGETFFEYLDRFGNDKLIEELEEYIRELSTLDIKEPSC